MLKARMDYSFVTAYELLKDQKERRKSSVLLPETPSVIVKAIRN
jgi:hypothetical protein